MNLIYHTPTAHIKCKENRHAQEVMGYLGMVYQHATPQSMYDCWQFWNCENVPSSLPEYLTEFKTDPMEMIGNGLSQEMAEKIRDYDIKSSHIKFEVKLSPHESWRLNNLFKENRQPRGMRKFK